MNIFVLAEEEEGRVGEVLRPTKTSHVCLLLLLLLLLFLSFCPCPAYFNRAVSRFAPSLRPRSRCPTRWTQDNLTNSDNTCQATGGCTECGAPCPRKEEGTITYMSGLFDLEADPREEHNVMDLHPEVIEPQTPHVSRSAQLVSH